MGREFFAACSTSAMFGVDLLYEPPSFANNSVMDQTMALFHARNTVLRALREVEVAHLEVENLGYSVAFFQDQN